MYVLADENFPRSAVEALRSRGHDVLWVRTSLPGISDNDVLARAAADSRLLVTFDKDFGEMAFRAKLPIDVGIVLFRIPPISATTVARAVVSVLESRNDWNGHFSVVDSTLVRMTPLPSQEEKDHPNP
jgi:predicted nuclease of predicted toxin-antitoxin system